MTVKILGEQTPAAVTDAKESTAQTQSAAEKPFVFTEKQTESRYTPRKRKAGKGFGSVILVQLLISALILCAALAAEGSGDERIREICTEITDMFR